MTELIQRCEKMAEQAKAASQILAWAEPQSKQQFLNNLAEQLRSRAAEILAANQLDICDAPKFDLTDAQIDRMRLTTDRLNELARTVDGIAELPEPIGRVTWSSVRPNGLRVDRVSVPLGVIFFVYESRPNVTIDAAALAIKSGNAIILRGGKEANHSNIALHAIVADALKQAGLPSHAVQLVDFPNRDAIAHFLRLPQFIDLAIPRGGSALIEHVSQHATMPVIKHFQGICHVYVDASADLEMAQRIIVNAKCQRPGVCNAAECLLIHSAVADRFLPAAVHELTARGVELRGCPRSIVLAPQVKKATDADYATEYLNLTLSVRIVDSLTEAISHIRRFGTGHTEAIMTSDLGAARRFTAEVDAAAIMVNASTRFHDGGEFGFGAEIGISTDKFHARGPCGLTELTSYKYIVYGDGQIRG